MDREFEKIKPLLPTLECNTMAAKEHVSKAERTIRTLKERTRGLLATLPFSHVPKRMKIEFVYFILLWLNAFPVKSGISVVYTLQELIVRWRLDYKKHCCVLPGTYCEVHDEPTPTNIMAWQTHECIALGPTGNLQGSVKFYCLMTGRILKHHSFTPMPMPDWVIKRVDAIGECEGQGRTFPFLNQQKEPYKWTDEVPEDDTDFQGLLENEEEAVYPDVSTKLPGVELKAEERDFTPVSDEPEADFRELATAALPNAGIDREEQLRAVREAASNAPVNVHRLAVVEANEDKIVYKITFDPPDAGLPGEGQSQLQVPLGNNQDNTTIAPIVPVDTDAPEAPLQCYPTRSRRSAVGNQPYDQFAPRVAFLQLGIARVHGDITEAS
jgi:hypothetical protein